MRKTFTYQQAAQYTLTFGPFANQTLDQVGSTDDGLRYLDNLNGKMAGDWGDLAKALTAYLADPTIAKELRDLIGTRSEHYSMR